jgi:hypothetical protein
MVGDRVHLSSCRVDSSYDGGDRLVILREHQGGDLSHSFPPFILAEITVFSPTRRYSAAVRP